MHLAIKPSGPACGPGNQADAESVRDSISRHLRYTVGKDRHSATGRDWYNSVAAAAREFLLERRLATERAHDAMGSKRVYYLSMEFLIGKTLHNCLVNLGLEEPFRKAMSSLGLDLDELVEIEAEAGLGNGGLGRLAACFLDSMAAMGIPGYGYGIRFEYGMFYQQIKDMAQVEHPDNWLRYGNPWELERPESFCQVRFGGRVNRLRDGRGRTRHEWVDCDEVMAMAYDIAVPGFGCSAVNNLRLWSARSGRDFDLRYFNDGDYIRAVEEKNWAENLTKILYPNDTTDGGKALRLKQEYFLVAATLQDILRDFRKRHRRIDELPDKVAIQMNDTHPSLAVPELMRLLVDDEGLEWDRAWDLTKRTVNYTNHTVLPEALEKWPVRLMEELLPRHLEIIYEINHRFLGEVYHLCPGDAGLVERTSIIEEGPHKAVRMANLAIVGSGMVNGVARIHTDILRERLFSDFHGLCPGKFTNKTNGISQRAWLNKPNRPLSDLITSRIGGGWITDLSELKRLAPLAEDPAFRLEWAAVKRANKAALAGWISKGLGITVDPDSMFDVHVKRIHEYKRQLLNILHIITLYNRARREKEASFAPRTFIFSGKAAPGYRVAKGIISLINSVADIVNNDRSARGLVKVVFIPNYSVSVAERIIPAADLSEQISTAGTEASGTGCMKLSLNGALTICTMDGANIEIMEEVGEENIFSFGLAAGEVEKARDDGYDPRRLYEADWRLREAIDMIRGGFFNPSAPGAFGEVTSSLLEWGDQFMVLADFDSYVRCQDDAAALYADGDEWTRRSILNVSAMGRFSSDRTIREYADEIWKLKAGKPG